MSVRYQYNRQVSPPAPFLQVTVSRPSETSALANRVPAQIDTAADFTIIPESLVETLQLVPLDQITVQGFDGHLSVVSTYLVRMSIHDFDPVIVRVLSSRYEPFILLPRRD